MADEKYTSTLSGQQMDDAFNQMNQRIPEGWAVGTKDGVDVPPTSIFYHNNAKYYAEQAAAMFDSLAGQYDSSQTYAFGDLCRVGNVLYICINPSGTTGTFVSADWRATTFEELLEQFEYEDENNDGNVVAKGAPTGAYTPVVLKTLRLPFLKNKYLLPFARQIEDTAQNDPANASFNIEVDNAEESPVLSTVIKGKTVAVNQALNHGNFDDSTTGWASSGITWSVSSNVATFTATSSGGTLMKNPVPIPTTATGNKYYAHVMVKTTTATDKIILRLNGGYFEKASVATTDWQTIEGVYTHSHNDNGSFQILDRRSSGWDAVQVKNCMLINLNKMFDSTELAGITSYATFRTAFLKKFGYPLPQFIPYDAGSLANVNGEYRVRGRNLWDEEWELGIINRYTGEESSSNHNFRSKNYIRVFEGETYYFKYGSGNGALYLRLYDANKQFITSYDANNNTYTIPNGVAYIRFVTDYASYDNSICTNLSDASFNGTYEPYYNGGTIDCSTAPLNGFDDTVCDVKNFATGQRTTKCRTYTFTGTETWTNYGTAGGKATDITGLGAKTYDASVTPPLVSDTGLLPSNRNGIYTGTIPGIAVNGTSILVSDNSNLTGKTIVFELATPVVSTETPQPLETQYGYNVIEPVSGGVQSASVSMKYGKSIKNYIDEQIAELQALVLENI